MSAWLALLRFPFLTVTAGSVLAGAALAPERSWALALLTLLAAALLHLATNVANDYQDFVSGVDAANPGVLSPFTGGSRVLLAGAVSPRAALALSAALFTLGGLVGLYLARFGGPGVLALGALGGLLVYGYAFPRRGFVYLGLGELAVFAAWGPLMVAGAYLVQTGSVDWARVLWGSWLPGVQTLLVLLLNEIPDAPSDSLAGRRTWATLLGARRALGLYLLLLLAGHGGVLLGIALGRLPAQAGLALLGLPVGIAAWLKAKEHLCDWPRYAAAIKLNILSHAVSVGLLVIGLIL